MRGRNQLTEMTAPPPSPIPTGKGSRSAANEPFAQFLDSSLQVPALSLPETSSTAHRSVPAKVDLRSLFAGADDSVDRILRSATEFGAFQVVGHGILVDELRSLVGEDEGESGEERPVFRERILWIGSWNDCLESAGRVFGDKRYRELSANMKQLASKLEVIAEQLKQILFANAGEKSNQQRKFEGNESVLSLYRYNHHKTFMKQKQLPLNDEIESKFCFHSLSLHLPLKHCQVHAQSEMQKHWAFEAGPETIVVTIGKQLEEWSLQEFKCFSGKIMFLPTNIREIEDCFFFSVEAKVSSSNPTNVLDRNCKTISIHDQIVIAITITLLYKFFMFLMPHISGA